MTGNVFVFVGYERACIHIYTHTQRNSQVLGHEVVSGDLILEILHGSKLKMY